MDRNTLSIKSNADIIREALETIILNIKNEFPDSPLRKRQMSAMAICFHEIVMQMQHLTLEERYQVWTTFNSMVSNNEHRYLITTGMMKP